MPLDLHHLGAKAVPEKWTDPDRVLFRIAQVARSTDRGHVKGLLVALLQQGIAEENSDGEVRLRPHPTDAEGRLIPPAPRPQRRVVQLHTTHLKGAPGNETVETFAEYPTAATH